MVCMKVSSMSCDRRNSAWRAPPRDSGAANHPFISLWFVEKAQKITPELVRVETHPEILHPQHAVRIDDRGQIRVIYLAFGRLRCEQAVSSHNIADCRRRAGEETPSG